LQHHFQQHLSLETAFTRHQLQIIDVEIALIEFKKYFFSLPDFPERTQKHIATPLKNSACKRLNMLLRWMVRKDENNVDFGIWQTIKMSQLICPLDVHVSNVAHRLSILPDAKSNWKNAMALTAYLQQLDPLDPAKYDYALFSLGVMEKYN
jgi:uncharacterized protein (TIGR02757 family)